MKKLSFALMCLAGVMIFTACGNKKKNTTADGKIDIDKVAEKVMEKEFSGEKYSRAAAEYYFKEGFGIDFKDMLPEYPLNDTSKYTFSGEKNQYTGNVEVCANFKILDDTKYTKEDHENNVRKIYALTKAVADNGINMWGFEGKSKKEEAMAEKDLEEMIEANKGSSFMGVEVYIGSYGWTFLKDGKLQRCEVSLLENRKEKDENGNNRKMGFAVKMYKAMDKSFEDTMEELDKAFEDPEVQKAVKEALENY